MYMKNSLRELRPKYLQRQAQEHLMEYPNASWSEFSTHIVQEDVMLQLSSNFLLDVEQVKSELATLGQEMRIHRVELQDNPVIAMEGTSRGRAPTQKGKKQLSDSLTIVIKSDTLKIGVARRCEMKKYEECNTICPSKWTLLPYENTQLATPLVDPSTIKTWTNVLSRMIWIFPLINF